MITIKYSAISSNADTVSILSDSSFKHKGDPFNIILRTFAE